MADTAAISAIDDLQQLTGTSEAQILGRAAALTAAYAIRDDELERYREALELIEGWMIHEPNCAHIARQALQEQSGE